MTEALLVIPPGGWTVDDLDALPESHYRHKLTDGALTVSPSPSSLHQAVAMRSGQPERHWFAPSEVLVAVEIESPGSHLEDRATKPALYAHYGIPHYWRIKLKPPLASLHSIGHGDVYHMTGVGPRRTVSEPFPFDVAVAGLLPRWAGRGEGPAVPGRH